jgi:hypothetical protein
LRFAAPEIEFDSFSRDSVDVRNVEKSPMLERGVHLA